MSLAGLVSLCCVSLMPDSNITSSNGAPAPVLSMTDLQRVSLLACNCLHPPHPPHYNIIGFIITEMHNNKSCFTEHSTLTTQHRPMLMLKQSTRITPLPSMCLRISASFCININTLDRHMQSYVELTRASLVYEIIIRFSLGDDSRREISISRD